MEVSHPPVRQTAGGVAKTVAESMLLDEDLDLILGGTSKEDLSEMIKQFASQGLNHAKIERLVFGYAGGAAYYAVRDVLGKAERKRDYARERIILLSAKGATRREIELAVFGYAGGYAHEVVKQILEEQS